MGRIGVSYLDIVKTANELQGKGINPTVDTVRELLGTGSRSTIGPYLKQWRNKQEEEGNHQGLPPELSSLVKGLYGRLQETADLKISEIEQQSQNEIAELQQKLNQADIQNTQLENELQKLNYSLTDSLNLVEQLKLEFENVNKVNLNYTIKLQDCEIRLNDRVDQIHSLEKQLNNAQSNLEHYRESIQAQREDEKRSNERELSLLNQEITGLRNQLSSINQMNSELTQKLDKITSEKHILEKDWYEQRSKTMELQEQLRIKELLYNEIQNIYKKSEEICNQKSQALDAVKADNIILREKLSLTEHLLEKRETALQNLQNERLFLTQENTALKAEVKSIVKNTTLS